jgi:hypothetical protein
MSETAQPSLAEKCDADWAALRAKIIVSGAWQLRTSDFAAGSIDTQFQIQIAPKGSEEWGAITLPENRTSFPTAKERDLVFALLTFAIALEKKTP